MSSPRPVQAVCAPFRGTLSYALARILSKVNEKKTSKPKKQDPTFARNSIAKPLASTRSSLSLLLSPSTSYLGQMLV